MLQSQSTTWYTFQIILKLQFRPYWLSQWGCHPRYVWKDPPWYLSSIYPLHLSRQIRFLCSSFPSTLNRFVVTSFRILFSLYFMTKIYLDGHGGDGYFKFHVFLSHPPLTSRTFLTSQPPTWPSYSKRCTSKNGTKQSFFFLIPANPPPWSIQYIPMDWLPYHRIFPRISLLSLLLLLQNLPTRWTLILLYFPLFSSQIHSMGWAPRIDFSIIFRLLFNPPIHANQWPSILS